MRSKKNSRARDILRVRGGGYIVRPDIAFDGKGGVIFIKHFLESEV